MLQNNPMKTPMPPCMDTSAVTVDTRHIHVWMLIPAARTTTTEASGHTEVFIATNTTPLQSRLQVTTPRVEI